MKRRTRHVWRGRVALIHMMATNTGVPGVYFLPLQTLFWSLQISPRLSPLRSINNPNSGCDPLRLKLQVFSATPSGSALHSLYTLL
jgi:hypothetical protein